VAQRDLSASDQPARFSLQKNEILRGEKQFRRLIHNGNVVSSGKIKCYYIVERAIRDDSQISVKVGFSVPRRTVRKAIDRNHLKRLMRESFRTQKPMLVEYLKKTHHSLDILFIYRSKTNQHPRSMKLADVQADITGVLNRLRNQITEGMEP